MTEIPRAGVAALAAATVYHGLVRPRLLRWGATPDEVRRTLPGDDRVPDPFVVSTRAVSIAAPPRDVWPWLAQLGNGRGGLYSYDRLDMLFGYLAAPSSDVILPQFQHLAPGDVIPLGAGPDWPVSIVEPERALVVEPAGQDVTWCWMLEACGRTHTRLISRVRVRAGSRPLIRLLGPLIDLPWFVMERKMLLGIKERAEAAARETVSSGAAVELYWIPLGAGGHSVRFNGRVFEAIAAAHRHRRRCDLYHAALVVEVDGARHVIEIAPSPDLDEAGRGVVGTGVVGSRHLGRWRLFRYEARCWRGGSIPDLGEAVGGGRRLTDDPRVARRLLELVPTVPRPVWGRDELHAGEMWNSNSMIAWLLSTADLSADQLRPPPHGRAPGWDAGLEVARRSRVQSVIARRPAAWRTTCRS